MLRKAIASGHFKPGEKLVERELCEMMGVSRPSIREALRRLEAEGLLWIVPHRGPMVATIGVEEARQIYAVRALLEGFAAQEFARYASEDQIAALKEALSLLERSARSGKSVELSEAKARFYETILAGCRNEIVSSVLSGLHNRVNVLRMTSMSQKDRLPRSLKEIRGNPRPDRCAGSGGCARRCHGPHRECRPRGTGCARPARSGYRSSACCGPVRFPLAPVHAPLTADHRPPVLAIRSPAADFALPHRSNRLTYCQTIFNISPRVVPGDRRPDNAGRPCFAARTGVSTFSRADT
ncbi:MAG: GntR family transcriptional regulator [Betaproteobacteria bacterium]|nr:GntR family transcriptional regulator [Betaproteobacteria bacterium]